MKNGITHPLQNVDVCLMGFFMRHPSINQRFAELTSAARPGACIVPHITRFCTLLLGLLESCKRIPLLLYSADETGVTTSMKRLTKFVPTPGKRKML